MNTGPSDDLVIRPHLRFGAAQPAARRALHLNLQRRAAKKASLLARLMGRRLIAGAIRGMGLTGEVAAGRALVAGGGIAAVLAVAIAVVVRLQTGRSFSNMGAALREFVFGGQTASAIAGEKARGGMMANRELMRIAGIEGITPTMHRIFEGQKKLEEYNARGRELFELDPRFQVNNLADMAILRSVDLVRAMREGGAIDEAQKLAQTLRDVSGKTPTGGR